MRHAWRSPSISARRDLSRCGLQACPQVIARRLDALDSCLSRKPEPFDIRDLIQSISQANPLWGSPRIVGELRKLGIDVAKSTVEKYRGRPRKPPSPTWKIFLKTHMQDLVSLDVLAVPTVTYKGLFVLMILAYARRRVVLFNVTEHPTAQWTGQQVVEAFPWIEAPRYLLRDRDRIYGAAFRQRARNVGIQEVLIAPRSP